MRFYLGTHQPHWLGLTRIPLFVSRRTLSLRKTLPIALGEWALDSGGFSELSMYGRWTVSAEQYVEEIHRFKACGGLQWCAPQDWMCEPQILKNTGLSVREHQHRTIESFYEMKELDQTLDVIPVLQGWDMRDYWSHWDLYDSYGLDLTEFDTVGIGSVCRRQHTEEVEDLIFCLAQAGLGIHGFGFKIKGLRNTARFMRSADSLAWSFGARAAKILLPECEKDPNVNHSNCANCIRYAKRWYYSVLEIDGVESEFSKFKVSMK